MKTRTLTLLLALWLPAASAADDEAKPLERAGALFAELQRRFERFDPGVAELYADQARIVNVRRYPGDLPPRALHLTGLQYKEKIRQLMPRARARRDYSTWSDVRYSREGERVRIDATRFSMRKEYSSPYSILVGPGSEGKWLIFEERSESRP